MSDYKRRKNYEMQNLGDRVDEVSTLPDCILLHILSFLPMNDVVKTSILSNRWKYLWTSVPNIELDDVLLYAREENGQYPLRPASFINFVERVLQLRDMSAIYKFRLSCRVCFNASRVNAWLSSVIDLNVQELDLCLFVEDPFELPWCMFDTKSLTILKIEMNCVLELPACICFPCLKTLHISLVTFPNDKSMQKLFSGCPILQELALLDCEWMNLKRITISSSTLKSLTIDDLPYFGPTDDPRGCEIKIDAANLVYLKYIGHLSNEIFLQNISSLEKAYIHIAIPVERQRQVAYHAVELFKGLQNVNSLTICSRILESFVCADNAPEHLPLFRNLKCLEFSMGIRDHTIGALMKFLHCCTNLQALYFVDGLVHSMLLVETDMISASTPRCMSSLKIISFKNFHGNDSETCFLNYFLKYASVLEKMNISYCKSSLGDPKKQCEVRNQLQMLAKASKDCVITFT